MKKDPKKTKREAVFMLHDIFVCSKAMRAACSCPIRRICNRLYEVIPPFLANVFVLYLLKKPGNLCFSSIFSDIKWEHWLGMG